MKQVPYKTYLPEEKLPQAWYNVRADMNEQPDPMIHPGTHEPMTVESLSPIFIEECCRQELDDSTAYVSIPGPVMDYYKTYRPSPLCRAYNLEKALDTPAKIYYKFEGNNTSGSHKLNSAIAQAYYAKEQGLEFLATETGAGQWGTALSMACAFLGLDLRVYMVKGSMLQKPYRKTVMETYAANVFPSPSDTTEVGRKLLAEFPDTMGSLGCAISEAIEAAMGKDNCRYALGSVLNHVLLHQSVVGLEAKAAMDMLAEYPDLVIGCAGGGSNLGGLRSP
jgi:tryptophan synthase beta chain